MYCTFYGLKERPFTLTPNPEFIFLGTAHQEAFAHLLYGIGQKVGFIALTGEVGAGKTTTLRTLLTHLEPATHATALILNPMLSSLGLLKTINREFGISDAGEEPAELVEILNRFLLAQKEMGKTVVLAIDEAQDMEPPVLEQVRLLSNLETATEKLIQIILVGQPEFEAILSRPELRQLNQRITVRYHMTPMSDVDTRDYLAHRLRAAGATPDLVRFNDDASRTLYKFSGGLPRLVNAVADRALLLGYNQNARQIDAVMTRQAIGEVSPAESRRFRRQNRLLAIVLVLAVLICGIVAATLTLTQDRLPQQAVADPSAPTMMLLQGMLQRLQEQNSSQESYRAILKAWQIPVASHDFAKIGLETALKQAGLDLFRYSGNLGSLARMGYPAILELTPVNGQKRYLVFGGLTTDQALVATETGDLAGISTAALEQVWTGKAIIPWKNVLRLGVPVPYSKNITERTMLAHLLTSAGILGNNPDATTIAEATVREAVKTFQKQYGIEAAGVAGGQTLLLLYRQSGEFRFPSLKKAEKTVP